MAYNDTPQANQRISDTQPLIRSNFQQIQTTISVNHVGIADISGNQGKHNFIQMPAAVPTLATSASEIGLYSKNGISSGVPELFFQRSGLAADSGLSITESNIATSSFAINSFSGYTKLPSGMIMKWGSAINNAAIAAVFPFPANDGNGTTIPAFSANGCFFVGLLPRLGATTPSLLSWTNTGFTTTSAVLVNFSYVAIGKGI